MKNFDRMVIVILENQGWNAVQGCKFVEWFKTNGLTLVNWHGVMHPSGPNYRAMFSGQTWSSNEFDGVKRPNVGDQIVVNTVSFKGEPAPRHDPMLDMQASLSRNTDVSIGDILYLGMDDLNNAHSGPLDVADNNVMEAIGKWAIGTYGPVNRTLLVVTTDEGFAEDYGENHVFTGMAGCNMVAGSREDNRHDHYSLYETIVDNWDLTKHKMELSTRLVPIDTYR